MVSNESYICLYCCVPWDKEAPIIKTITEKTKNKRTKKSSLSILKNVPTCPICSKEVLIFTDAYNILKRMARTTLMEKPILNDNLTIELNHPTGHLKFKTIASGKVYDVVIVIHKGMISSLVFTDNEYLHKIKQLQERELCANQNQLQGTTKK